MSVLDDLRNLDLNEPGRWPLPFRIAAVAIVFVGVSTLGIWHFVYKDEIPELQQAVQDEQTKLDLVRKKQQQAVNLDQYIEQRETIERDFAQMLSKLPGKSQVDNLLEDISRTAGGVGLEQRLFDPQNWVSREFYAELPVLLRYEGSYHEIGQYISAIAKGSRIVTLHDIQISPVSIQGDQERLLFSATAKTYRYLEEEESP